MNPADILAYGQMTVRRSLKAIPEAEWLTPNVCGIWSTKDIIAHLASFECALDELLQGFAEGREADGPTLDAMRSLDPDAFNALEVGNRKSRSAQEVLQELESAHARVLAAVPRTPAEVWRQPGTLPWYGAEYALDDFIVYTYYGHKREHSAQIDVFKDRLKGN